MKRNCVIVGSLLTVSFLVLTLFCNFSFISYTRVTDISDIYHHGSSGNLGPLYDISHPTKSIGNNSHVLNDGTILLSDTDYVLFSNNYSYIDGLLGGD